MRARGSHFVKKLTGNFSELAYRVIEGSPCLLMALPIIRVTKQPRARWPEIGRMALGVRRIRKAYMQQINALLTKEREELATLETGGLQLLERKGQEPDLRDVTSEFIASHKRTIEIHEGILSALLKEDLEA
jgi:hypothetical protein